MEKAAVVSDSRNLCRLIRNINPRKSSASEVINESDGTLIHSHEHRFVCSIEQCRTQFN